MLPAVLLGLLAVSSAVAQCSYDKGDLAANWTVSRAGILAISFENRRLENNQWTAMGFGPGMSDLEVVVFKVENNTASSFNGYTTGYAPPRVNNNSTVTVTDLSYTDGKLSARITRPLLGSGPDNKDLSQCMSWKFVAGGDIKNGRMQKHSRGKEGKQICPGQCVMLG